LPAFPKFANVSRIERTLRDSRMLYFAYGSNIDEQRVKAPDRCPNARFIFHALLPGHRLVFSHRSEAGAAADVIVDSASSVWGVVYDIAESDRKQLDRREAAIQHAHRPREVLVHPYGDNEQKVMVITYAMSGPAGEHQPPTREYLECMLRGARQRGFPADYIAQLERIKTA
jgi:gamma-glutamylcyclotransferase